MTSKLRIGLFSSLLILIPFAASALEAPKGWGVAGSNPAHFDMGLVKDAPHSGKACAVVKSKVAAPKGFGTLMQNASPKPYLNKRVRLSAWVKGQDIKGWGSLWFRVDKGTQMVSFDNMVKRPLKGTFDWKKIEIVLDVPPGSTNLAFGPMLNGAGALWIDDLKLEKVSKKIKLTSVPPATKEPLRNLNFEQ